MAVHLSGDFLLLDGIEDLIDADAALFPAIGDFEIRLRQCGQLGVHLDLCSKAAGRLAGFSYWDHADADLREMNEARIPIGTADAPYHDHEQGWEILIWRRGADVFVLEGQDDPGLRFSSRFRVAFEEYRSQWSAVFAAARTSPGTFKSLEAALREPNLVTGLLLGNRRLTKVPHAVTWMKNLEFIDLYLNRLTTLPSNMGALQHLRWLDLRFNRIAMLPDSMGQLRCLESVNLAENHLTDVPEWAYALQSLRVFFVQSNPIPETSLARFRAARPDVEVTHASAVVRGATP